MNRSIDGVVSAKRPLGLKAPVRMQIGATRPTSQVFTQSAPQKKYLPKPPRKSWKGRLQLPIFITGGMLAGLAIQNPLLGQLLIVGYGVVACIYKISSRASFIAALAALLIMFCLLMLNGDPGASHTFAVYTFLLLVVGVITLNREVKQEGGRVYSRRYR